MSFYKDTHNEFAREVKNIISSVGDIDREVKHLIVAKITMAYGDYCRKHEDYILDKITKGFSKDV